MTEQFQDAKPEFTRRKDIHAQEFSTQKHPMICLEIKLV